MRSAFRFPIKREETNQTDGIKKKSGDLFKTKIVHGMAKKMPIALVESGTTSKQKVITGTLSNIKLKVSKSKVKSPALIIVGTVVTLRDKLNWFK